MRPRSGEFVFALSDLVWVVRKHELITEVFKGSFVENLRKYVSEVLLGRDMLRNHNVAIPKCLNPLLATVDVFQLRLLS